MIADLMAGLFNARSRRIERAIALEWLWRHESGAFVKFTDSGAALFA